MEHLATCHVLYPWKKPSRAHDISLETWLWRSRRSFWRALQWEPLGRQLLDVRISKDGALLFSAVPSSMQPWVTAEINATPRAKQRCTTHTDGGDVREVCWWKWYCLLQFVFNSYLLSFLMKPRFYQQHEVEWIFISHASTKLSARSNYAVLWEAARTQLDFPIPALRCLQGRHLRK